jgi:hypothetical protein
MLKIGGQIVANLGCEAKLKLNADCVGVIGVVGVDSRSTGRIGFCADID